MTPLLVHIRPYDTASDTAFDVRVADGPAAEVFGLGGYRWSPAMISRPNLSIELMSVSLDGRTQLARASLTIALARVVGLSLETPARWLGAEIKIYSCSEMDWGGRVTEFDGFITSASFSPDTAALDIQAQVRRPELDGPLLTAELSGAGGSAGDASKRGTLKPAGFGVCEYIPPVWIDETRWIGLIDGYGNTVSIQRLMEGASDFGTAVADYPSYAALAAAIDAKTVAPGMWATCIAEGMIGLGAPPAGAIGVNATFGSGLPGALMQRLITVHAGVAPALVDTAAYAALDVAVPYPVHYWTASQRTITDLLEAIAGAANATPLIGFDGRTTVSRAVASSPVATLNRSGSVKPRVTGWSSASPIPPFWRIKARAARPVSVLDYTEVLFLDSIDDKGLYNPLTVYRAGNIVWLSDKSSWLNISATPVSGYDPPVWPAIENSHWRNLSPPTLATRNLPGQMLQDGIFGDGWWSFSGDAMAVGMPTAPLGQAAWIPFIVGTASFVSYGGSTDAYAAVQSGKSVYLRFYAIAGGTYQTQVVEDGVPVYDGGLPVVDDIAATPGTWDLEVYIDWYGDAGYISRTSLPVTAPTGSVQVVTQQLTPPAGSTKARVIIGHSAGAGETGEWLVWSPWFDEHQPAADVTADAQVTVEMVTDKTVAADYLGAVSATNLEALIWVPSVLRGGVVITVDDDVSYAISGLYGIVSGTGFVLNNTALDPDKGQISIAAGTALSNTAGGNLVVTVAGTALPAIAFKVVKQLASPPPPATGQKTVTWASGEMVGINTTSYTTVLTTVKTVALASGETLYGSAPIEYYVAGMGAVVRSMTFKWQYAVAGSGTWNDFGAGITGSLAISGSNGGYPDYEYTYPEPGYVAVTQSKSGLAAGDYDIRLVAICSATGKTCTPSGGATMEAKV